MRQGTKRGKWSTERCSKLYGDLIVAHDLTAVSEIVGLDSDHNFGVIA
jgi:hypothetical protein